MNYKNRPFFKGLPRFVSPTDAIEAREAQSSVYYWWWEFLQLSPVLWFAQETGHKPMEQALAEVSARFGDLRENGFSSWWRANGANLFAEAKRPAKVTAIDLNELQEHRFDPQKLYLEIPLTIRRQTILKQFKALLSEKHEGRALDLAAHSLAQYKLHTKRYRLLTLETEYWVLLYRLLHPKIEIWRIGDRLQLSPAYKVRDANGAIEKADDNRLNNARPALNALTGRHYYKGRFTLLNVERGSFPNAQDIELSPRHQPFGIKHQKDYRAATEYAADGTPSKWHLWLAEKYGATLKYEILRRLRLTEQHRMPGSKLRRRFDAFIAGTSDLLS